MKKIKKLIYTYYGEGEEKRHYLVIKNGVLCLGSEVKEERPAQARTFLNLK